VKILTNGLQEGLWCNATAFKKHTKIRLYAHELYIEVQIEVDSTRSDSKSSFRKEPANP